MASFSNKAALLRKVYHQDDFFCEILQAIFIKENLAAASHKMLLGKLKKDQNMFSSSPPLRRLELKKALSRMF